MWAATGGLDFDGRERWEAWNKMQVRPLATWHVARTRTALTACARARQGMSKADAQKAFCNAYGRAQSRPDDNFRKF